MKLKINISVILGFALCVALVCGIWALGGKDSSSEVWSPNQMYGSLGEGPTKISRVKYASGSVSSGSDVLVPMSSGSRRMASASRSYVAAPAAGPSAPSMSFGANGPSPISYTASSAGYHSFGGGGGNGGASGAMTGRSSAAQGMPAVGASMVAYSQMPTINMNRSQQGEMASSEPIFAVLSSYGNSSNSSVLGGIYSYGNLTANAHTGVNYAVGGSTMGVVGRRNGAVEDSWLQWLSRYGTGYGTESGDEENGFTYSFDIYQLDKAYQDYVTNYWNDMWGTPPTFDQWLEWFQGNDGSHGYHGNTFSWVPVGDYYPLLILALLYACVMLISRRKQQISENNI